MIKKALFDFDINFKTIGKSATNSILIQIIVKMKGIITMPIMTYYMTPTDMGAWNLISVTAAMMAPLFSLNLTDGPAIYFVQERSHLKIRDMFNTVVNSVLILAVICSVILWSGSCLFAPSHQNLIAFAVFLILSTLAFKVVSYVLVIYQKTSILLNKTVIKDIVGFVLSVTLVVFGFSYKGIVASAVVADVFAAILIWRIIKNDLPYRFYINRKILVSFLKIALPLLPVFFFSWIIQSSDSYFIAYFQGKEDVGKYAVIYGLSGVILSITFALNFFWFPVSARLWVEDRKKYLKAFKLLFAFLSTALFLVVTLFEFNSATIIKIFARRPDYHDAHLIMGTISFAFSMQVMITLLTAPLYSNKNTKAIFVSYFIGGLLNVFLNILFIPRIGIVGAAVSTALSYFIIVLIMGVFNYKLAEFYFIDDRLKFIIPCFFLTWALAIFFRGYLEAEKIIAADVLFIVLSIVIIYAFALRRHEREYIGAFLTGLGKKFKFRD